MVEISVNDEKLILQRIGREPGATERIVIPLEYIAGASADSFLARNWLQKQQFLARYVPRAAKAGTQYEDHDCIFWEIENPEKTIVIYLEEADYNKLVIGVKNPFSTLQLINQTLGKQCGSEDSNADIIEKPMPVEEHKVRF